MIKSVIFDLDDTLYNEKDFVAGAFAEVCKYLSKKYSLNYYKLLDDCIEILDKKGRGKIFNILCKNYNLDESIENLIEIYRNSKPKLNLYEDSYYILDKLLGKYKLGIITDGISKVQWNKIEMLGICDYFDKIIVTDDLGKKFWKPNKFTYLEILKNFKCLPKEAIYIGDNPYKDFIGAKKLGINTIRIIRGHGDYVKIKLDKSFEANYTINSLKEVFKYLK